MDETTKSIYRVRGIDLDHDDERYPEGAEIVLTADEATRLKPWIEAVPSTAAVTSTPPETNAVGAGAPVTSPRPGRQPRAVVAAETTESKGTTE